MGESTLSERLKLVMDEYFDGKQNALALAIGCSESYVSSMLSGKKTTPKPSLMANLVNSISGRRRPGQGWDVTVGWLLGGGALPSRLRLAEAPSEDIDHWRLRAIRAEERLAAIRAMTILPPPEMAEPYGRVSSTPARDQAEALAMLDEAEDASAAPGQPPTTPVAGPSAGAARPSGAVSPGTRTPHASPARAPGEPVKDD